MSRFQFVADHRDIFEVKRLCQVLGLNRSSYYAWAKAAITRRRRARADQVLARADRPSRPPTVPTAPPGSLPNSTPPP